MKNIIKVKHLIYGLATILICGCSDNDGSPCEESTGSPYSIAIAVKNNSLTTSRTAVVDPGEDIYGKQHATRVQLYIYKQENDDYICVTSEDISWKHLDGAMAGLDTRQQGYRTKYQDYEDGKQYLFLAVGFDDTFTGTLDNPVFQNVNSVAAYGQPEKIATEGKKLSEEHFKLQDGADVNLIAQSELFAGSETYTKQQLKDGTALSRPIILYRRVAGVMGYFKKLPAEIDGTTVAHVKLRLYKPQNREIWFLPHLPTGYATPDRVPDNEYTDYITSGSNNDAERVIADYEVTPEDNGTFSISAYLLPIAASTDFGQSTLELVMTDSDGNELARRRIFYLPEDKISSRSGTGIIDTPEDVGDSQAMHYPIRANHFYRMGKQNAPIDLSGQSSIIYIEIDAVWDEYYGGAMDNDNVPPGLGIDKEWGEHDGGTLGEAKQ